MQRQSQQPSSDGREQTEVVVHGVNVVGTANEDHVDVRAAFHGSSRGQGGGRGGRREQQEKQREHNRGSVHSHSEPEQIRLTFLRSLDLKFVQLLWVLFSRY
jgi:hypothetical protein